MSNLFITVNYNNSQFPLLKEKCSLLLEIELQLFNSPNRAQGMALCNLGKHLMHVGVKENCKKDQGNDKR